MYVLLAADNVSVVKVGEQLVLLVQCLEVCFKIILVFLASFGVSIRCEGAPLVDPLGGCDGGECAVRDLQSMSNRCVSGYQARNACATVGVVLKIMGNGGA